MKKLYKKIFISIALLLVIEIFLGFILKYNVNKTQFEIISFMEIIKVIIIAIIVSIATFIIFNVIFLVANKTGIGLIINVLKYCSLIGPIIMIIILGINIHNDIYYNIIGIMLVFPVLLTSIIWITESIITKVP